MTAIAKRVFVDDIAIVSVAKMVKEIEEKTNKPKTIQKVRARLDDSGWTLAAHKTQAVLISSRMIEEKIGSDRWRP